ncbi:aldo/keto reductase family protein [Fulvivirga imtechensis AK7]|uniref:Aldo/keto reductase family protein n=1 Tax=Fulvivirga imtechensis AK7 TaxID=1237149 RepID=L8JNP0_9BACT|nr:aldo/keto reductase [Fulvivirga imtechensis]ELR70586.1 aldo/keto reductase family protein [Fulvivirga imtechensis AK7]
MISKLGIGTVQFGLDYGISNIYGKTSLEEVKSILQYAKEAGVDLVDTAKAYGESEKVLGQSALAGSFKIVSKCLKVDEKDSLQVQLAGSLKALKVSRLYGYMAHDANFLIENSHIWEELLRLKNEGMVARVGVSLYTLEQLHKLWSLKITPDLVQVPYNLLDRKFESCFEKLKADGTEIHCRSIFLQGLFFMSEDQLSGNLQLLKKPLAELRRICFSFEISMEELALNFVVHNPAVDYAIIGVNTLDQLKANVLSLKGLLDNEITERVKKIDILHSKMLNPVNWK